MGAQQYNFTTESDAIVVVDCVVMLINFKSYETCTNTRDTKGKVQQSIRQTAAQILALHMQQFAQTPNSTN